MSRGNLPLESRSLFDPEGVSTTAAATISSSVSPMEAIAEAAFGAGGLSSILDASDPNMGLFGAAGASATDSLYGRFTAWRSHLTPETRVLHSGACAVDTAQAPSTTLQSTPAATTASSISTYAAPSMGVAATQDATTQATAPAASKTTAVALGADVVNSLYGVTGAGIKIGVISDSFNTQGGAAADISAGILPANVDNLVNGSGEDEGRTMIEDAYAIAPNAQYLFASAGATQASFESAVFDLENAGANVIIDDEQFPNEPLFQTGSVIDDGINSALSKGIDYFTSAGNTGDNYIEQGFKPISVNLPGVGQVTANDFGGGSPVAEFTLQPGAYLEDIFGWAQPSQSISGSTAAQNSLALYVYDLSTDQVVTSLKTNEVGGNAIENLNWYNSTGDSNFGIAVVQNGGVVPTGQLFKNIFVQSSATPTPYPSGAGDLVGHEELPGVNVVGAVNYQDTPNYGVSPSSVEPYSARGPGEILYDASGNLLATPIILNDPQFDAPDGTSYDSANGIQEFGGTSAAAPAAGAVAALVLSANDALTTTQITSVLAQSTVPVTGADSGGGDVGGGLIQARAAVEIGVADGGDRWTIASGGDWANGSSWSLGASPTSAESVSLSDNLGAITGSYTVTVDLPGEVAGSIAISAPTGSSATLVVSPTGGLTVGGATTTNPTAGDLLTADNGSLIVQGGLVSVTGSINNNDGTVALSGGQITADNYTQNSGQFTLGGGAQPASLDLTGAGYSEIAGTASVLSGGDLTTSSMVVADSTLMIAGLVDDTGSITYGTVPAYGKVYLESGGQLELGGSLAQGSLTFQGGGLLDITSSDSGTLTTGLEDYIFGLGPNTGAIDFSGLAYNPEDTLTYNSGNGSVEIFNPSGTEIAEVGLDPSTNYTGLLQLQSDGLTNHEELVALCFCSGTLIATPQGDRPVEALQIGDLVMTADGELEAVRWIGRRSYSGAFVRDDPFMLPVCIKAGALADCAPRQDLWVSPGHALVFDGHLVPAWRLINGVTIVQATEVDALMYHHVELERHAVIFANGAPAESYLDDGRRRQFHNADDYEALYPEAPAMAAMAPRLECGFALQAIQSQIDARAGLTARTTAAGPLRGFVDRTSDGRICGWAQDMDHPEAPVRLELTVDGRQVLCLLANGYRADLREAKLGSGRHGFDVAAPAGFGGDERIEVRRVEDGASLSLTDEAKAEMRKAA